MKLLKVILASIVVLVVTIGASQSTASALPLLVPAKPGASCPANGALINPSTPPSGCLPALTFKWSASAPLSGFYDIEISKDPGFSTFVDSSDGNDTSSCSISAPTNTFLSSVTYDPSTTYYWRVQAYDSTCAGGSDFTTGGSGWAVFTFRTPI